MNKKCFYHSRRGQAGLVVIELMLSLLIVFLLIGIAVDFPIWLRQITVAETQVRSVAGYASRSGNRAFMSPDEMRNVICDNTGVTEDCPLSFGLVTSIDRACFCESDRPASLDDSSFCDTLSQFHNLSCGGADRVLYVKVTATVPSSQGATGLAGRIFADSSRIAWMRVDH